MELATLEKSLSDLKTEMKNAVDTKADGPAVDAKLKAMGDKLVELHQAVMAKRQEENSPKSRIFQNAAAAERCFDMMASVSKSEQLKSLVKNTIAATSGPAGSYLPADEFSNTLLQLIPQYGASLNYHDVKTISGQTWEEIKKATIAPAIWQLAAADGTGLTPGSPTFATPMVFTPELLYHVTPTTFRMNKQSRVSVAEIVMEDAAQSLGLGIDLAVAKGDGSGTFGNITGYCADSSVPEETVTAWSDLIDNSTSYGYKKLVSTMSMADESVIRSGRGAWYGHVDTFVSMLGMTDANGQPIINLNAQNGVPPQLLGQPIKYFNALDSGGDYSGNCRLLFGDLRTAGKIVQNGPPEFSSSDATAGIIEYRHLWLVTFALNFPNAVARLVEA